MRRCFGLTRNLNRCGRIGDWRFFCYEHKKQPLAWMAFFTFTVLGGAASIISYVSPPVPPPLPANKLPAPVPHQRQGNQAKVSATVTGYLMDTLRQQPAFMVSLIVNNDGDVPVILTSLKIDMDEQSGWVEADGVRPVNEASWRNRVFDPPFGLCIEAHEQRVFGVFYLAKKKSTNGQEEAAGLDYFIKFTTVNIEFVEPGINRTSVNAVKLLR